MFLGVFAKLRKRLLISSCLSVRVPVRMEQLGSHWTDFHEIWYVFVEHLSRKFKFHYNRTRITVLYMKTCPFSIISHSVLLTMKPSSDKSCRETRNTHFMFNNFFSENRAVYEIMWKVWRAGQGTDNNMAHAHCVLDNYGNRSTLRLCSRARLKRDDTRAETRFGFSAIRTKSI